MEIEVVSDEMLPYKVYDIKAKDMEKRFRVLTDMLLFEGKESAGIPGGIKKFYHAAKRKKRRIERQIEGLSQEIRNAQADIALLVSITEFPKADEVRQYLAEKIVKVENYKKQLIEGKEGERIERTIVHLDYIKNLSRKERVDGELLGYFREELEGAEKYVALLDRKRADLRIQRDAVKKCIEVTEEFLRETFYKFIERGVDEKVLRKVFNLFAEEVGSIKMDYIIFRRKESWDCDWKRLQTITEEALEKLRSKMESAAVSEEEKIHLQIMVDDMQKSLNRSSR